MSGRRKIRAARAGPRRDKILRFMISVNVVRKISELTTQTVIKTNYIF